MKFTQNGYTFSDEHKSCKLIDDYANEKGVSAKSFYVESDDGTHRAFVLYNNKGVPIFESSSIEAVAVHVDIMSM